MKKRMLIAFALIAILATSAFAADFGWGGAFRSVWAVDMGTDNIFSGLQFGVLSANAKLDDNNTVTVVLEYADNGSPYKNGGTIDVTEKNWVTWDGGAEVRIETAALRTDIFGALGLDLPVTLAMNNGMGRLNLHDRFNGVGTGWDPEILKGIGALDTSWARYTYTGFDLGIMDIVNVRLYSNPATWNSKGANILAEVWAPIAIADIMTLDIGAFMIMNNGLTPVDTSVTGKMITGLRVKGDMSFGIVGLGFWLGGTMTNESKVKDNKNVISGKTSFSFVEAVNASFAFNDAMSLKVGVWALEGFNTYTGDELDTFNLKSGAEKLGDPTLQVAFDLAFNYAAFTVFGGFITGDMIPNLDHGGMNGRWEAGVGYGFGATSMRLGVTGMFYSESKNELPGNDGLSVCGPASTMYGLNSDGKALAEVYFMAGVWF